jgi:GGDEF domain-containing protein
LATSESTRARRFALPNLVDERAGEAIEAFLEGPDVRRARAASRPDRARSAAPRPATDLGSIPGRLEWNAALGRESLRAARYGRPAAVAIVELKADRSDQSVEPWLRTIAGPVARALRADSRATDLVARIAASRFQILLPETTEASAEMMAQRLAAACRAVIEHAGAPVAVRVSVAGTDEDETLDGALAHALRSIEAA